MYSYFIYKIYKIPHKLMDAFIVMLQKKQLAQASAWYRCHYGEKDFVKRFKVSTHKIEKKKYYYLITFTLRKDRDDIENVEAFIKTQAFRPALQIIKASFVRELTKGGRPHWHMAVISTKIIKKDRFNYYQKHYGNIDISKNKHNTTVDMLDYMCKSNTIEDIL